MFMPCSGLNGTNLKEQLDSNLCPWFKGPAFIPYINDLPPLNRNVSGPFMMPLVDRYNDRGTIVMGKVESGSCRKGDSLLLMPNKVSHFSTCLHFVRSNVFSNDIDDVVLDLRAYVLQGGKCKSYQCVWYAL